MVLLEFEWAAWARRSIQFKSTIDMSKPDGVEIFNLCKAHDPIWIPAGYKGFEGLSNKTIILEYIKYKSYHKIKC